jgi:hypothetical protein
VPPQPVTGPLLSEDAASALPWLPALTVAYSDGTTEAFPEARLGRDHAEEYLQGLAQCEQGTGDALASQDAGDDASDAFGDDASEGSDEESW